MMRITTARSTAMCLISLALFVGMIVISSWTQTEGDKQALLGGLQGTTASNPSVTTLETTDARNSDVKRYLGPTMRSLKTKQRLKTYCRDIKSSEGVIWHMKLNHKLRLAYCFVPKVASRTLRRYFHVNVHAKGNESLTTYTQYMFVREPFGRLLSAYKDKFVYKDRLKEKWMQIERKLVPYGTPDESIVSGEVLVSFKKFIEYVISDVNVTMGDLNRHWKTFHEVCMPCTYNYDFIGRYEFLSDDVNYLRELANAQELPRFPESHESKTSDELISYYSQIPPKWIMKLGEIYKADFQVFGYPFPGPLKQLVNGFDVIGL